MSNFAVRLLRNPRTWPIALGVYWLALFLGTHIPTDLPLGSFSWLDKALHFFAFAGLAMLVAGSWEMAGRGLRWRGLLLAWLAIVVYGALDEWTQNFVGRHASVMDWVADAAGAAVGIAMFVYVRSRLRQS